MNNMEVIIGDRLDYRRLKEISSKLNALRLESKFSDLMFVCYEHKTQERICFNAHQSLFSTKSRLLRRLFYNAKSKHSSETIVITLDEFDSGVVEKLIEYIYTGVVLVNEDQQYQMIRLCNALKLEIPLKNQPKIHEANQICEEIPKEPVNTQKSSVSISFKRNNSERKGSINTLSRAEKYLAYEKMESQLDALNDSAMCNEYNNEYDVIEIVPPMRHLPHVGNAKFKRVKTQTNTEVDKYNNPLEFPIENTNYVYVKKEAMNGRYKKYAVPKKCNECAYEARGKTDLNQHMNEAHDMQKVFKCTLCSYITTQQQVLSAHINGAHYKIGVYSCDICEFSTNYKSSLSNHKKNKHDKIKNFNCNFCSYATFYKYMFEQHILNKHREIVQIKDEKDTSFES